MASTRLTNSLRAVIVDKLIERTFPERYKAVDKKLKAWVEKYHTAWHAGHDSLLKAMPLRAATQFVNMYMRSNIDNRRSTFTVSLDYPLKSFHDFPSSNYWAPSTYASELTKLGNNPPGKVRALEAELDKLIKERTGIESEESKARTDARAILGSVTTHKALLQVWPEIAEVIGSEAAPKPQRALVKNLGALNAAFGLVKPLPSLIKKRK